MEQNQKPEVIQAYEAGFVIVNYKGKKIKRVSCEKYIEIPCQCKRNIKDINLYSKPQEWFISYDEIERWRKWKDENSKLINDKKITDYINEEKIIEYLKSKGYIIYKPV